MPPPSFGTKEGMKTEPMRLRQVALAVGDLGDARRVLTTVLGTEVCYIDPGVAKFGLENFLLPLGGDLLEVVSPIQTNTTVGRLLDKRGDGGYMIIMQNLDASARRKHIESLGHKVIWGYSHEDVECVQYHPKGIKGGIMPELDSHAITRENPKPLKNRFSPWHAYGPDFQHYSALMRKYSDLHLLGVLLRLEEGDVNTEGAAREWRDVFGVDMAKDLLAFTNARMGFVRGKEGMEAGLESLTVGVEGRERFDGILGRAREEGVCGDEWVEMCGVKWYFVLLKEKGMDGDVGSKL